MSTIPNEVKSAFNVFALMDIGMTEAAATRTAKQWEDKCAEAAKLHHAIDELHRVWWTDGTDLNKDAVASQCLSLFAVQASVRGGQ